MPRKLISFLGTGKYDNTTYYLENKSLECETPFIQLALTHIFKPDEVVLFLTPQAENMNWLGVDQKTNDKGEKHPETGLKELAHQHYPEIEFIPVSIPNGQGENEIWKIFDIFCNQLQEGDTVIFDITHSFRSIPIISLACLHFVRSFKNVTFEGVYYGNWEAREKKDKSNLLHAPIVNLTPFVELMDWSMAVSEFVSSGQSGLLKKLMDSESKSFSSKKKGQLRRLAQDLDKTSKSIVGCRGKDIFSGDSWKNITSLTNKLRRSKDQTVPALTHLLDLIDQKITSLTVDDVSASKEVKNGLGVVHWCLEHNHIQQAYAILQETLITHLCDLGDIDTSDRKMRQIASQCVKVRDIESDYWHEPAKSHPEIVNLMISKAGNEFFNIYKNLSDLRNDVMHCKLKSDKDFSVLRRHINSYYSETLKILSK